MITVKNKKINKSSALNFGFKKSGKSYEYAIPVMNNDFLLTVKLTEPNIINTILIEKETKEPYTLHLSNTAGDFVGKIREEYNNILNEIENNCFEYNVFKSPITKEVIKYIKKKYNDYPEHLWEKFPDNAIARRKDNKKWYLVIMTVKKFKLGLEGDENTEIIDFRANPGEIGELTLKENIYRGYHMNKNHWITILLDGSMPIKEIYKYLDKSYELAKK